MVLRWICSAASVFAQRGSLVITDAQAWYGTARNMPVSQGLTAHGYTREKSVANLMSRMKLYNPAVME